MRNFRTRRFAALLLAAVLMPIAGTLACQVPDAAPITPFDGDRMTGFEAARFRGLAEALLSDNAAERALVSALFAPGETPISQMPDGSYRCRTIKLGGLLPLTAYTQFACTVSNDGTRIEKLTGSQRFSGDLLPSDGGGLFYWGALHYGDETPWTMMPTPNAVRSAVSTRLPASPCDIAWNCPFPALNRHTT
ncbi:MULTISPECIES: DUF4893 domain-containing protein [Devosia]|uniref:DUF4893 domain-containing protein n=1 Tax=Devosia TaxID=46913 RepID=UPI000CE95B0B|nr:MULTISPECIES: DUF4893 domain-containing protein [Devosia]AVF03681.1 hypothetical protein C4375_08055 [Devosia sp. I507]